MLNHHIKGLLLLILSLIFIGIAEPALAAAKPTVKPSAKLKLQKINSRAALAKLIMSHHTNRFNRVYFLDDMAPGVANTASENKSTVSHSDTNIQVQGVDESDTVKIDDSGFLYQLNNNQIRIIKGFPLSELNQVATLSFSDINFYPTGLYVQSDKLVVLGTSWQALTQPEIKPLPYVDTKMIYGGWWNNISQTKVLIYDVSDHTQPKQIRDVAIDGDFINSRRIGDDVYFVTRTYPHYYMYGDVSSMVKMKLSDMLPNIIDTQSGTTTTKLLPLKDLAYFPEFAEPDYVVIASVNLAHPEQDIVTKAYLGAGEMIYASTQNLYLSASKYNFNAQYDDTGIPISYINDITTRIYKFGLLNGQINFSAAGEVPGTVLNQFSMDEKEDYFRIATTTQDWYSGLNKSTNSLFVLNKNMKTVGKLTDLAPGEQIYATRFVGDRCYIVTFRLVDPLFAIDLSIPDKPTVMGELKIPGYSNYLHPYDETHLIGFGKDAAVYNSDQPGSDQFWPGGSAFYQGLKVALFDVADLKNPKELHSVTIGDRGSNSPLLWDHKALYWDSKQHLFGFPVELYQLSQAFDPAKPWTYGLPTFQGAYLYEVTPEQGFTLRAKLTQIPPEITPIHVTYGDYEYAYWDWDVTNWFINRILRIDNYLFTLSNKQLNAYDLDQFQEQGKLTLTP